MKSRFADFKMHVLLSSWIHKAGWSWHMILPLARTHISDWKVDSVIGPFSLAPALFLFFFPSYFNPLLQYNKGREWKFSTTLVSGPELEVFRVTWRLEDALQLNRDLCFSKGWSFIRAAHGWNESVVTLVNTLLEAKKRLQTHRWVTKSVCSSALITLLIQEKPLWEPLGQNLFSPSCKSLITGWSQSIRIGVSKIKHSALAQPLIFLPLSLHTSSQNAIEETRNPGPWVSCMLQALGAVPSTSGTAGRWNRRQRRDKNLLCPLQHERLWTSQRAYGYLLEGWSTSH